jgi:uncharacterized protein (AIM24 family)
MPVFTVTGDVDPFLHVSLKRGEKIYCESDAMVMMEATLDLKGKITGGIGSAIMRQYMISDGAFVAATSGVELKVRTQSLGNALFAQSGGFFITETAGSGQLAVSGFGSISQLDVEPGKDVVIDNSHVVCWDSSLRYEMSVTTGQSGGFLSNLVNSQTSGEGMVLRFSGQGKILVCSRNRRGFLGWVRGTGQ